MACSVRSNRRLTPHADNAKLHTSKRTREFMEKNSLSGAPLPPSSPDLTPSDFCLFGSIKDRLQGTTFMEKNHSFAELCEILNGTSSKILKRLCVE
jgi:hypothetical protein